MDLGYCNEKATQESIAVAANTSYPCARFGRCEPAYLHACKYICHSAALLAYWVPLQTNENIKDKKEEDGDDEEREGGVFPPNHLASST